MRFRTLILAALALGGCCSQPHSQQACAKPPAEPQLASYEEAPAASALVFDLPLPAGEQPIELTREERQPSAFVGYDGPITTSFWIYTNDSQQYGGQGSFGGHGGDGSGCGLVGNNSYFQRDAVMVQTGVRTR